MLPDMAPKSGGQISLSLVLYLAGTGRVHQGSCRCMNGVCRRLAAMYDQTSKVGNSAIRTSEDPQIDTVLHH